jgi:hypothetical protein
MKHPSKNILFLYTDNELNIPVSERVRDHLLRCDQCSSFINQHICIEKSYKDGTYPETIANEIRDKIYKSARSKLAERKKLSRSSHHYFDFRILIPLTVAASIISTFVILSQLEVTTSVEVKDNVVIIDSEFKGEKI